MPTWLYEGRNSAGQPVKGSREGEDRQSVLEALRGEGLFLTKLEVGKGGGTNPFSSPGRAAVASGNGQPANPVQPSHPSAPSRPPRGPAGQPGAPNAPYRPQGGVTTGAAMPTGGAGHTSHGTHAATLAQGKYAAPPVPDRPFLRAGHRDLSLYFRQLAAMVHAGTSIGHAIGIMAGNAPSVALRQVSTEMQPRLLAGVPLSVCMKPYPGVFSPLQIGMISAGERGGFLEQMLSRLAAYSERDFELETMVRRETFYPKLLVGASVFIPAIVPLVLTMVQGGGVGQALLAWMRFLALPVLLIGSVVLGGRAMRYASPAALGVQSVRRLWDSIKLFTPVSSRVTRNLATAKFCRALGALYAAGVGPGESIRLSSEACGNSIIGDSTRAVIRRLERGESFTSCLSSTGYFSPMVLQMLQGGEESGMMDEQLGKAADFLETETETSIRQSVQVLGVLAFLLVAAYIGMQVIKGFMGYVGQIDGFTQG